MLFGSAPLEALATARNIHRPVEVVVREGPRAALDYAPETSSAEQGSTSVATTLDALAAAVPAGVAGLYTLAVVPIRQAVLAGDDERAREARRLVEDGLSGAQVRARLSNLPQETSDWLWLRLLLLVVFGLAVVVLATRATRAGNRATERRRRLPVAEPAVAVIAFLGWALGSPGTPLAAWLDPGSLGIVTTAVVAGSALVVTLLGASVLARPARGARSVGT